MKHHPVYAPVMRSRRRWAIRVTITASVAGAVVALPAVAWAHGIGGRSDLPVPLHFFLFGAAAVLLLSFGALAVLWPEPRLQDGPRYRGEGWTIPRWITAALGAAGVAALLVVAGAGLFGDAEARTNIAPVSIWVVFWLVLPFLAAAVGNVWAVVNPWATLGRWLRLDGGPAGPGAAGVWPAGVAFVAFTWLELVFPDSADPRMLGLATVAYSAYLLAWMYVVGVERTVSSADAFSVYHRAISAIAPLGRDDRGRLRRRGWLRALTVLPEWRGLVFFVVAMIGTVSYDGLSATAWWDDWTFDLLGRDQSAEWFGTISLLGSVGVIGAGYLGASWWASRIAGGQPGPLAVARSFAHTLVPIALAYAVAHYVTLIAFEGQQIVRALSDPFGLGWNLFGTADFKENFTWLSPTAVWWIQVVAIVGGHVAGVVLAHDRALAIFPRDRAVRTQYAMLGLMVALTGLGLAILAA